MPENDDSNLLGSTVGVNLSVDGGGDHPQPPLSPGAADDAAEGEAQAALSSAAGEAPRPPRRSADVQYREDQRNQAAQARADAARQQAERQRLLTESTRARVERQQARAGGQTGFDADAGNSRASSRPMGSGVGDPGSVLSAPPDAGLSFDADAYEAARYAGDGGFGSAIPSGLAAGQIGFSRAGASAAEEGDDLSPYEATRRLADSKKADILADAQNLYTERGDFNLIGTPLFHADVREAYQAAGLAPPLEKPGPYSQARAKSDDLKRDLNDTYTSQNRFSDIGGKDYQRDLRGMMQGAGLAPPPEEEFAPEDRSPYAAAAARKSGIESMVRDDYAARGDFEQIGSSAFRRDVQGELVEAGLAEAPKRGLALVKERLTHDATGIAFGVGYSAMSVGSGVAAMERLNEGQYVTPEQRATAEADAFAPAAGGIAGTVIGTALGGPAGGLAGQFIGGAVGQAGAAAFGASEAREQATREAAERLAAALGEGASAVGTFKAQIEATGAPVAQLGQALQTVGTIGTYGSGTVAGVGALTNAFQERAGEDFAAISRYTSSPLMHGMGNRFSTGAAGSEDIQALGYDAAEQGDFAGLKTFQQAARDAQGKNDPQTQALARDASSAQGSWWDQAIHGASAAGRTLESHLGPLGTVLSPVLADAGAIGYDPLGDNQKALDDRRKALAGGPDPVADAQNALANQFVTLKSDQIVAESDIKVAQGGISLAELRGASAAKIASASQPLYADVSAARTATSSEIGLLQGDLANPINAGRADELRARIADAQARLTGYDVTEAQQKRRVFGAQVEEESSAFGLTVAGEQQDLTRGEIGGRSFASLQGDENRMLSSDAARAAQLRRTAANPINSPAERDKYLAEATGIETQATEDQYRFGLSRFQERERDVATSGAEAGARAQQAETFGTPMDVYNARLGQVGNERAQLGVIDDRLRQTIPNAERQDLTRQRATLEGDIAVGPEQARVGAYDAQGGILSDTQAADRAQLSRNVAISGSGAYGRQVFDDDDARINLFRGAEAGSPVGSVQRARFGRERAGAEAARLEDLEQSQVYRETATERTQDTTVEHSFRRAMEAPFLEGPDSNVLTRGNALLGNLRGRLGEAQRTLSAATDPLAREQDTEIVEGLKDRITSFEHDRLYEGVLPQEVEKRIGSPGGGIGVAITPLSAAATGSGPYNPAFGGFGSHPNPLATAVGGIEHEGGAMGMWWATRGGTQGSGQSGAGAPVPAMAHPSADQGVVGQGGKTDELLAQAVRFLAQIAQNGRGFGQAPPMSPQAAVQNYHQDNARF